MPAADFFRGLLGASAGGGGGGGSTLILDGLSTQPTLAFALKKRRTTYSGSLIDVAGTGSTTSLGPGADGISPDASAIAAASTGGTGKLRAIWNQGSNTSGQPKTICPSSNYGTIYASGAPTTLDGSGAVSKLAVTGDFTHELTGTFTTGSGAWMGLVVFNMNGWTGGDIHLAGVSAVPDIFMVTSSGASLVAFNSDFSTTLSVPVVSGINVGCVYFDGTNISISNNGVTGETKSFSGTFYNNTLKLSTDGTAVKWGEFYQFSTYDATIRSTMISRLKADYGIT